MTLTVTWETFNISGYDHSLLFFSGIYWAFFTWPFFLLPGAGRPKAFLILESHRGKLINWIRPNRSAGCARNRIRSAGLTASCSNRSAGFTAQTDYIGRGLENTGSTNDRKCI